MWEDGKFPKNIGVNSIDIHLLLLLLLETFVVKTCGIMILKSSVIIWCILCYVCFLCFHRHFSSTFQIMQTTTSSIERSNSEDSIGSSQYSLNTESPYEDTFIEKDIASIEEEILDSINKDNREKLQEILISYRSSVLLQLFLTYLNPNRTNVDNTKNNYSLKVSEDMLVTSPKRGSSSLLKGSSIINMINRPLYSFDTEVTAEAHELLGTSLSPLSFMQIACILGQEDQAIDILEFVYKNTHQKQKLLLLEFLGKIWGEGNTTLHLASFQGMSDLVKRLLEYGANPNKANAKGYKVFF